MIGLLRLAATDTDTDLDVHKAVEEAEFPNCVTGDAAPAGEARVITAAVDDTGFALVGAGLDTALVRSSGDQALVIGLQRGGQLGFL